jgi:hypothetical protein
MQRPHRIPQRGRPVVETAASHEPAVLDAGHEIRPSVPVAESRPEPSGSLLGLVCNGAAALIAIGAALAAHPRRRRLRANPTMSAQVLHLPQPALWHRRAA